MHFSSSTLVLSATDLGGFSECEHKTLLDIAVAEKKLERPGQNELERKMLELRGVEHEKRVLEHYESSGRSVVRIPQRPRSSESDVLEAAKATEAAMQAGADVVYQGVLFDGSWLGRPDFLLKAEGTSRFGEHGYEVVDAKLAREAKAAAVLQLCTYSDHLARVQGRDPERFWIASGRDDPKPLELRAADYMAYYRQMKGRLEAFARDATRRTESYPEPVEHCGVCQWWKRCEDRRRADDHLSLVAGITRRQRDRLAPAGVARVVELAALSKGTRVDGITEDGLERIRDQAALQIEGRKKGEPVYKLLPDFEPHMGLEALPTPKPGDLFLDLEGDPFVRGEGLEYLFGLLELGKPSRDWSVREKPGEPRYLPFWATNPAEEKRAFEAVVDRIMDGLEEFRDLHVFHFGHRESDALKTLSCRHHTREDEVDELLRRHVLVDLHRVVKQAVRASVEAYTLKDLELLYGFRREVERRDAARAMQFFCWWLETGEGSSHEADLRATLARYNEDDCRSAWQLRDWLEARRPELETAQGRKLARPALDPDKAKEKSEHQSEETANLAKRLSAGFPEDPALDSDDQRTKRLVANLLDWHWREAKSSWWEWHRTVELPRDEHLEDRAVLGGLTFVEDVGPVKRSRLHRYEFPEQEHRIRVGDKVQDPETEELAGEVMAVEGTHIDLKRNPKTPHPKALIPGGPPGTKNHRARLFDLGNSIVTHGLEDRSDCALARELLLRKRPNCGQAPGAPLLVAGSDTVTGICELALRLNGGVLAVQGPPGSGKTHRAAHMIAALIRSGKRVGVTANSHKVITSLLEKAVAEGEKSGFDIQAVHNPGNDSIDESAVRNYELDDDHESNAEKLAAGTIHVLGGTSWAWSRPEFRDSVDVLVVDEAGQVSLANVLAVCASAKNLVMFGDPAQLDQPQKGTHPPGAEVSALEHLLGTDLTLPDDRGVFLAETRRLHPAICNFTSSVFYDGRLEPIAGLEKQRVLAPGIFEGAGLRFVPVAHRGNTNKADEEVATIEALIAELARSRPKYIDKDGKERDLRIERDGEKPGDLLVVAPYNAQVAALRRRLPTGVAVGTVDKFQGQQAPIVIYSMTSSSAEDAPRGMEFLYSSNRLNVATSRAEAVVVLVASPELMRVRCKTPRQMRLANAMCAYLESADSRDLA
jgi:predicted RecB family nuclease